MVIKSLTRKSGTGQLVKYVCRYITDPDKQSGKQLVIRHNLKGKSIDGYIKQFKENAQARKFKRADMVVIRHTVLSFSPRSREFITDKKLRAIAKEYIKHAGPTCQFLMAKHTEGVKHVHLHVVQSSGTIISGKSANLSRAQFAELKLSMNRFIQDRYPELSASLVHHGKAKENKQRALPKLERFHSHKAHVSETIKSALSKTNSLNEFLHCLRQSGLEPYYRGSQNTLTGIQSENGQKYRFSTFGVKDQIQEFQKSHDKELDDLSELRVIRERSDEKEQTAEIDDYQDPGCIQEREEDRHRDEDDKEEEFNELDYDDREEL